MVIRALHDHRRDARIWVVAAALHIVFIAVWLTISDENRVDLYRHSITFAMVMAAIFYSVVILAVLKAHKSRLNKALALNKTYWLLLIVCFAIPLQTHWWDAAPYSVRTYIWLGIALSVPWVLYEFVMANWAERLEGWPHRDRRQPGVAGRRAYDRFPPDPGPGQERM